ncbi:MAG: glycosyltransferase family 4 protein, partial [Kiritimatiellia bacterium]
MLSKSAGIGPTILVVGNFLGRGLGSKQASESLGEKLADCGWQVITTSPFRAPPLRLAHMLTTAIVRRKVYQIALVDLFSGRAFIWAEWVCRILHKMKKPYVLILRGGNLPQYARQHPERVRQLQNSASALVAPSTYLVRELASYCTQIRIVRQGLDLARYAWRLRTAVQPRLVWLRAYERTYNPLLAVQTMLELLRDFPSISLSMAGPAKDNSLNELHAFLSKCRGADRITLTGALANDKVAAFLSRGDIFLNTTDIDNTPVSVMEAMATGLCAVSTNVGGIPDMLKDGYDALLVPPRNTGAMAAAVRRILTTPDLAQTLSRNRRLAAEQHDWSRVLPEWHALLG